jgi:hypothetical protein
MKNNEDLTYICRVGRKRHKKKSERKGEKGKIKQKKTKTRRENTKEEKGQKRQTTNKRRNEERKEEKTKDN